MTLAVMVASMVDSKNKEEVGSNNIFIETNQLIQKRFFDMVILLLESEFKPTVFILDLGNTDLQKCEIYINQLVPETRVVFVSKKPTNDFLEDFSFENILLKFNDLTDTEKSKIFNSKIIFQGASVALKDILTMNSEILYELPLEYILGLDTLKIQVFDDTLPKLPNIFIERRYLQKNHYRYTELDRKTLIEKLYMDKCVILAASAGMGKTSSAVEFAKYLKSQNSRSWVVFIDLKQHVSVYSKDGQKPLHCIDPRFVCKHLLRLENELEEMLFEEFFRNGKTIFIIDGFDEVSPTFKNFVMGMIKSIRSSGNLMIVTTRTHLASELSCELRSDTITLKAFSRPDQVTFIEKFFKSSTNRIAHCSRDEAEKLLSKMNPDFVSTPLLLYMMSEVFSEVNFSEFPINSFSLYYHFIKKLIQIWEGKGLLSRNDNDTINTTYSNVKSIHLKIAVQTIFGEVTIGSLGFDEQEIFSDELILRIGLIKMIYKNRFEFTHKTFAEFLVAEFSFNKMTSKTAVVFNKESIGMFRKIFLETDYENIRNFIYEKLKTVDSAMFGRFWDTIVKQFGEEEQKTILYFNCTGILHEFIENADCVQIVLENIGRHLCESELRSFLLNDDWLVDVVCYYAFGADVDAFLKIWAFVENKFEEKEKREYFLTKKFVSTKNVIVFCCTNKRLATTRAVLYIAEKVLEMEAIKDELKTQNFIGYEAFHHVLLRGNIENYIKALDEALNIKITEEEIKAKLKKIFHLKRNIVHKLACNYFDHSTWEFVVRHLGIETVKLYLLAHDAEGKFAFSLAAYRNKPFLIDLLIWFKLNSVHKDELKDMFKSSDHDSNTLMHAVAFCCDENLAREVCDFLFSCQFDHQTNREILLAVDKDGDAPLYIALFNKYDTTVHVLWDIYKAILAEDELEQLIDEMHITSEYDDMKRQKAVFLLQSLITSWMDCIVSHKRKRLEDV